MDRRGFDVELACGANPTSPDCYARLTRAGFPLLVVVLERRPGVGVHRAVLVGVGVAAAVGGGLGAGRGGRRADLRREDQHLDPAVLLAAGLVAVVGDRVLVGVADDRDPPRLHALLLELLAHRDRPVARQVPVVLVTGLDRRLVLHLLAVRVAGDLKLVARGGR